MTSHRGRLPQLDGTGTFIADGGLETTLVFQHGLALPCFAAFHLLRDDAGRRALRSYFEGFVDIAVRHDVGLVVDTPTWRANPDWGAQLGYSTEALDAANRSGVALAEEVRAAALDSGLDAPVVISGAVGPRGDGYRPATTMSAAEAERYHHEQLATFADTAADMVTAYTLTYADEAIGIVRAGRALGLPTAISFTVETDGSLPDGQALADAIEQVDAATDGGAAYFLINCAHPTHFTAVLEEGGSWIERLGGLRANASAKSHAELDESDQLDDGDPVELGAQYRALRGLLPNVTVLGGCCGTDHRHVAQICSRWLR